MKVINAEDPQPPIAIEFTPQEARILKFMTTLDLTIPSVVEDKRPEHMRALGVNRYHCQTVLNDLGKALKAYSVDVN